jgi:hypothetical protein
MSAQGERGPVGQISLKRFNKSRRLAHNCPPTRLKNGRRVRRPEQLKTRRLLVHGGGRLSWGIFGQALRNMGNPISGQHLGLIGLLSAFALPDLLRAACLRRFAIFGSYSIRVDQLLRKAGFTKKDRSNKAQVPKRFQGRTPQACGYRNPALKSNPLNSRSRDATSPTPQNIATVWRPSAWVAVGRERTFAIAVICDLRSSASECRPA